MEKPPSGAARGGPPMEAGAWNFVVFLSRIVKKPFFWNHNYNFGKKLKLIR
jgi:hypothetical protein